MPLAHDTGRVTLIGWEVVQHGRSQSPDLMTQLPGPPLPTGDAGATKTHGFLFADLRGYTRYVDAHGDHAAAELLERYRALVRSAVAASRGAEIKTEGDSFYVVFDSASAAVRCGLAIVEAAAATSEGPADAIEVGVGVHAGETVETAEGYVGSAVNIAARLCAQAKAGELVVSETVRALTRTYLDVEFEPLGTRRLKGLDEPIAIDRVLPRGAQRARGRPRPMGQRRGWRIAGIAAAGVVVLLGVVGAAVTWQGARPVPSAAPSQAAGVTPTAASTVPSTAPSGGAGDLTMAEQALKARIPSAFRKWCVPSSPPEGSLPGAAASLRCDLPLDSSPDLGADVVWYDAFDQPGLMATAVSAVVEREQVPALEGRSAIEAADCTSGAGKAVGRWSFGITFTGQVACYPKNGGVWMFWTYEGAQIAARAVRPDGDATRLYDWWYDARGYLGP